MNESIVQWTLLNNLDALSELLNFKIAVKRGQEVSTDFGRIDFVLENYSGSQMVVELETKLDNKAKLDYCFDQVKRYKNVSFPPNTEYCILYASETKPKSKRIVRDFGKKHNVTIRTYSIDEVKTLYVSTVEKLSLSFGLVLPDPKTYTICHLRWLNKILKPFDDYKTDKLSRKKLARYFTSPRTTNFRCYLKLALVERIKTKTKYDKVYLTPLGVEINNIFSLDLQLKKSRLNLNFKYLD